MMTSSVTNMTDFSKRLDNVRNEFEEHIVFDYISAPLIQEKIISKNDYKRITNEISDTSRAKLLLDLLITEYSEEKMKKLIRILKRDYNWLAQMLEEIIVIGSDEPDFVESQTQPPNLSLLRYQNIVNEQIELNQNNKRQSTEKSESKKRKNSENVELENVEEISLCEENRQTEETRNKCVITPPTDTKESISTNVNKKLSTLHQVITPEMMTVVRRNHRVTKGWTGLAHSLGLSNRVHNIRFKVTVYGDELDICVLNLLEEWVSHEPETATLEKLIGVLKDEGFQDVAHELETKFVLQ